MVEWEGRPSRIPADWFTRIRDLDPAGLYDQDLRRRGAARLWDR